MKHVAADAANEFRKFIPFSKVEELEDGSVIVEGIATAEVLDSQGEIVGYEASKAAFEEWSDVFSKMTDGASLGNIREMHGPVAAGKALAWWPDEAKKSIVLRSKIVDAGAAKKCKERVYTGYSISAPGDSVERKKVKLDGKDVPYISKYRLSETSTVDRPACPEAVFTLVKRDGGAPAPAPIQKDAKAIAAKAAAAAQAIRALQVELVTDEKVPCWSQREALTALENILGVKIDADWRAQMEAAEALMSAAGADKIAKGDEPGDTPPADPPAPAPVTDPAPAAEGDAAPPAADDAAKKAKPDPPAPAPQPEPVKKIETQEALEKILAGQDALKASVATITEKVTGVVAKQEETATAMKGLEGRLSKVESTPAAAGSPAQVVEKSLGAISSAGIVPSPSEMRKTVDALEVSGQVPAATIAEMRKGLATLELMKASAAR